MDIILKYFKFLKDNLTVTLLSLTLIGCIGQFIKLVSISPSLLIFFSASQAIIEGIMFLITLIITAVILLTNAVILFSVEKKIKNKFIKLLFAFLMFFGNVFLEDYMYNIRGNYFDISKFFLVIYLIDCVKKILPSSKQKNKTSSDKESPYVLFFLLFFFTGYQYYKYYNEMTIYTTKVYEENIVYNIPLNIINEKGFFNLVFVNDKYVIYKADEHDLVIVKELNKLLE